MNKETEQFGYLSSLLKQMVAENQLVRNAQMAQSVQSAVEPKTQFVDVYNIYAEFEKQLNSSEEALVSKLKKDIEAALLSKQVKMSASKGTSTQSLEEYIITVQRVSVAYIQEKYYIVLTGKDNKDYYVNTKFKIQILA